MLEAHDIHKKYGSLEVLKGVGLTLNPGEVVALVGASGAGKSTLLQILGALDQPDSGFVLFKGQNISSQNERNKAEFRNNSLGFVFQFHHLLPEFNALENVVLPALIKGEKKAEAEKRAVELLNYLNLGERAHHKPSELSGGEQQRVAVARSLINSPALILADEPTGNLDTANGEILFNLFLKLAHEKGVGILITTHNNAMAQAADRTLQIQDGRMV